MNLGQQQYSTLLTTDSFITWTVLTDLKWERETANISSVAADRQTYLQRDVLKELGMDDQVMKYVPK
jgi:hypothetical protein